jgi:NitT/TauT family transport system substrate-binding protein
MGFFKDAGLNASLEVIGTTVSEQVPQLLGRQFDIASMTPPALITSASVGLGTGVVAASYKIGKDDEITLVVASPDSGIKTPEDLVGKRLAAPSIAGNVNTGTMYWLTTLGIDPKSVDVVAASTPNMPDLLRSGQIDAAELTMPYVGMMMGEGYTVVGNPLPAVSDPVQMSAWCANVEWANNNPEAIKRFRQALQTTVDWIAENPEKAIDILFEKTKVPAEYKPFMNLPDYDIAITAADLDAWINAMNVVSGFTSELPTEQMVVG